ncbi:MAG: hypothetical protein ACFCU5_15030 [Pleurocapsa sp.]
MFLSELAPVWQKLMQQPLAFTGGFVSGIFKLKLDEQPLSDWLTQQGYTPVESPSDRHSQNKPQSISID